VLKGLRVAPSEDAISTIDELDRNQFMLAASPQMLKARSQAALVAKTDIPVYCSEKAAPEKRSWAATSIACRPRPNVPS